jgi:hypothetical protein
VENPLENPGIKVPRKSQIVRYVTREISTEIREVVLEFTEMIEAISVIGGRPLRLNAPIFTTAQD